MSPDYEENLKRIESMTPCEQKGWKVGDKFVLKRNTRNLYHWFLGGYNLGDVITLSKDDGTRKPWFEKKGYEPMWALFDDVEPYVEPEAPTPTPTAVSLLRAASDLIDDRGKERDKPNGERSMAKCVNAFNAITGHTLTEEQGWMFMVHLKQARMQGGCFRRDDYEDAIAYSALQAEAAVKENE